MENFRSKWNTLQHPESPWQTRNNTQKARERENASENTKRNGTGYARIRKMPYAIRGHSMTTHSPQIQTTCTWSVVYGYLYTHPSIKYPVAAVCIHHSLVVCSRIQLHSQHGLLSTLAANALYCVWISRNFFARLYREHSLLAESTQSKALRIRCCRWECWMMMGRSMRCYGRSI